MTGPSRGPRASGHPAGGASSSPHCNPAALQTLISKHEVQLRRFPDDVIVKLRELSDQVVAEIAQ